MFDILPVTAPGSAPTYPIRCECPTCGREGCSGDCDWSGPPEDQSDEMPPVPPAPDSDDDDDEPPSGDGSTEDAESAPAETYESRVEQAILGVMDGEDD